MLSSLLKALISLTIVPVSATLNPLFFVPNWVFQISPLCFALFLMINLAKVVTSTPDTAWMPCCLEISMSDWPSKLSFPQGQGRAQTCTWNICHRETCDVNYSPDMTRKVSSSVSKSVLTLPEILGAKTFNFLNSYHHAGLQNPQTTCPWTSHNILNITILLLLNCWTTPPPQPVLNVPTSHHWTETPMSQFLGTCFLCQPAFC